MITLALAQMVFFFSWQAPFTGGEDHPGGAARQSCLVCSTWPNVNAMYAFVLAIFLGGFLLIYRIVHSPFGQVLKAIRENEPRAMSLGYDADKFKHRAIPSARCGRLAGATKSSCSSWPADRRALEHVGRGGADDARGRHGHHLRPVVGRGGDRHHAELPGTTGRLGDGGRA